MTGQTPSFDYEREVTAVLDALEADPNRAHWLLDGDAPLTHDDAVAIFDLEFATPELCAYLRGQDAHQKLWEDAHPGCAYHIRPETAAQREARQAAESAAWRKKTWEDAHPGELYDAARDPVPGFLTVPESSRQPAACAPTDEESKGPRLYTIEQLIANPDLSKPREPVAAYVAYRRALVLVPGREKKAGKSTLLTCAAGAVVNARPFLGAPTTRGPVLWVTADREHTGDVVKRARQFGADHDLHVLYPRTGTLIERLNELEDAIRRTRPVWVIIDTLANFVAGVVQKASQPDQWPVVLLPLRRIMETYNVAITLVHHAKKDEQDYRDSTAIGAAVDMIVTVRRHRTQATWRELLPEGRWTLHGVTVALTDVVYRVVGGSEAASVTDAGQARQRVLDALGKESSAAEVAEATGLSEGTVRSHLRDLVLKKLVTPQQVKRGRHKVTVYRRAAEMDVVEPANLDYLIPEGGRA